MGSVPRKRQRASWEPGHAGPPFGEETMNPKMFVALVGLLIVGGLVSADQQQAMAGEVTGASGYKALEPIRHGNLTGFPVVSSKSYHTSEFFTLDEGLRSGEVVVTEYGNIRGLIRRHPSPAMQREGAQVNRLVLINNSNRPLLLLAGEIVAGGKQDRVIGKDRIVPAESDPVDLSVFCVEPGRWVAANGRSDFGYSAGNAVGLLASPVVRSKAMGAKDQQQVWDSVRSSQRAMAESVEVTGAAPAVNSTTSYARVMDNKEV